MEIIQDTDRFVVTEDSEELGFISCVPDGDVLTVDHTEVSSKLEGKGMGKKLVGHVVQYARDEGKTIDHKCPFARSAIEKPPEFYDVLSK